MILVYKVKFECLHLTSLSTVLKHIGCNLSETTQMWEFLMDNSYIGP
jgi:hypothetical protein